MNATTLRMNAMMMRIRYNVPNDGPKNNTLLMTAPPAIKVTIDESSEGAVMKLRPRHIQAPIKQNRA
jgi:hypothetical protein